MSSPIEQVFAWIDAGAGLVAGETIRVLVWGLAAGVLSMLVYRRFSPQARLQELGVQAADARRALNAHTGDFSEALVLMRASCTLSLQRLKVALLPSLLAGLPVILLLIGLQPRYESFAWIESGPEWVRSWLTLFFGSTLVSALALKFVLKIQ